MDFIRRMLGMGHSKPCKIQDAEAKRRVGVTASSLKELIRKSMDKLEVAEVVGLALEDGTIVTDDDYFRSLPPQSVIVVLGPGQSWDGYLSYLRLAKIKLMDNLSAGGTTVDQIQQVFCDPESPELNLIMEYVKAATSNVDADTRLEDPEWFQGLPRSVTTKERAMKDCARSRIRGFLWKSKEYVERQTLDPNSYGKLCEVLDQFREQLKRQEYFAGYFARSSTDEERFCDAKGWFSCEGPYNRDTCEGRHIINPYGSRDSRVLFSTWNLDHRVEKTREIMPVLVEAVRRCPRDEELNWMYFFALLFTRDNLKLVDIRCHSKEKHAGYGVDSKLVYLKKPVVPKLPNLVAC